MAKLKLFVHVVEKDENGQPAGRSAMFGPEDELPDWAIASISNPDVWAVPPAKAKAPAATEPVTEPVTEPDGGPDGGKVPAKAAARKAGPAKANKEPADPPPADQPPTA